MSINIFLLVCVGSLEANHLIMKDHSRVKEDMMAEDTTTGGPGPVDTMTVMEVPTKNIPTHLTKGELLEYR